MLTPRFQELMASINAERAALSFKKNKDYAADEDYMKNFKRLSAAAAALNINVQTPTGYGLFMVLMKLDRFNNLYSKHITPNNEGVYDTVMDGHNYLDLAYACMIDAHEDEKKGRTESGRPEQVLDSNVYGAKVQPIRPAAGNISDRGHSARAIDAASFLGADV